MRWIDALPAESRRCRLTPSDPISSISGQCAQTAQPWAESTARRVGRGAPATGRLEKWWIRAAFVFVTHSQMQLWMHCGSRSNAANRARQIQQRPSAVRQLSLGLVEVLFFLPADRLLLVLLLLLFVVRRKSAEGRADAVRGDDRSG